MQDICHPVAHRLGRAGVSGLAASFESPQPSLTYGAKIRFIGELNCSQSRSTANCHSACPRSTYGRSVGAVACDGVEVSDALVRQGSAWTFKRYLRGPS